MELYNVTFDAADPPALARFWSAVLERPVDGRSGDDFAWLDRTSTQPAWLFIRVPEGKSAKNRVHVDLDCDDLAAARQQLEALGASFVHEQNQYGVNWMTFRDPEGNEFCVAKH